MGTELCYWLIGLYKRKACRTPFLCTLCLAPALGTIVNGGCGTVLTLLRP
jgi:hypothetical protein